MYKYVKNPYGSLLFPGFVDSRHPCQFENQQQMRADCATDDCATNYENQEPQGN